MCFFNMCVCVWGVVGGLFDDGGGYKGIGGREGGERRGEIGKECWFVGLCFVFVMEVGCCFCCLI